MFQRHIRQEKIVDYVLGQLSSKEHFRVNAHLAKCEQCSRERDYWQDQLHVESIPVPSIELERNIFLNIEQKRTRNYPKLAYLAISFCVLLLLTIGIWQQAKTPTMTQSDSDQPTELQEIASGQLTVADLSALQNIMFEPAANQVRLTNHHAVDPTEIQSLFEYIARHTNESMQFSNLVYVQANSGNQTVHKVTVEYNKPEPIVFMNEYALCLYDQEHKDLICVPIEVDSQTNQLILLENEIMHLKYHK